MKKKCFVIAPIGEESSSERKRIDSIIDNILKPTLNSHDYDVKAAHSIQQPGIITSQIVEWIFDSDLIIADLTSVNGNVMYELAIADFKRKPVLRIAVHGTKLPFDIQQQRVFFYDDNISGSFKLKAEIENAVQTIKDEMNIDNPISVVLNKSKTSLVNESTITNTIKSSLASLLETVKKPYGSDKITIKNVEKTLNESKTDQIIREYLKGNQEFNSEKFHDSICFGIENKKFPEEIHEYQKGVEYAYSHSKIKFDYLLRTANHAFLVKIAESIFRISLMKEADKINQLFAMYDQKETLRQFQPIIIIPSNMPASGKLLKKIPLLKFNIQTKEFTNWPDITPDFGKIFEQN